MLLIKRKMILNYYYAVKKKMFVYPKKLDVRPNNLNKMFLFSFIRRFISHTHTHTHKHTKHISSFAMKIITKL